MFVSVFHSLSLSVPGGGLAFRVQGLGLNPKPETLNQGGGLLLVALARQTRRCSPGFSRTDPCSQILV